MITDEQVERAVLAYDAARCATHGLSEKPMSARNRETIAPMIRAALTAALAAEPVSEPEPVAWECFRDDSYYDLWCVRKVGDRRFGEGFHVSTEDEAKALVQILSAHPAPTDAEAIRAEAWTREDLAEGLALLDGVRLQRISATVGPPEDANNWRKYLADADDLLAHLSLAAAIREAGR